MANHNEDAGKLLSAVFNGEDGDLPDRVADMLEQIVITSNFEEVRAIVARLHAVMAAPPVTDLPTAWERLGSELNERRGDFHRVRYCGEGGGDHV